MMTEPVRKTSLENKHLRNCDYFAIIPSCSHFKMLTKNSATGLVWALSKYILTVVCSSICVARIFQRGGHTVSKWGYSFLWTFSSWNVTFNSSLKFGIGNNTDHCSSKSCLFQSSSIFTTSNLSFLWKGEPSQYIYTFCCSFRENTQSFALKVRQ